MAKSKSVLPLCGAPHSDNSPAAVGIYSQEMHRHVFWEEDLQQRLVVAERTVTALQFNSLNFAAVKRKRLGIGDFSSLPSPEPNLPGGPENEWKEEKRMCPVGTVLPKSALIENEFTFHLPLGGITMMPSAGFQRQSNTIVWIKDSWKQVQDVLSRNSGLRFSRPTNNTNVINPY